MVAWAEPYTPDEGTDAPRQVTPDPRPEKRLRATQDGWAEIRAGFEHATCVHCGLAAQSLHHILPRSQGGGDVEVNLAPLCGTGTTGCHGLLEGHGPGWERVAAAVRQYVITDNARRRYQEEHADESFNRRYPPLPNTDRQFVEDFARIYRLKGGDQ